MEQALHPVERDKPSYLPVRLRALATGQVAPPRWDGPVAPGVEAVLVPVTRLHTGVKVSSGGTDFFYLADAVPTAAARRASYIMSYDLYPVAYLRQQKGPSRRAADEGWILGFSHDLRHPFGAVRRAGKSSSPSPGGAENV